MILLRLISWPYFRKHVLRTLLTVAGIVLGVAVFVGMHVANESVMFAFDQTVSRIAGKTELQVTAGESGFGEEVLERVQAVRCVRVAVPVIEAVADTNVAGQGSLLVLGVDMTGDRSLRDYDLESGDEAVVDDPLVFLAQPDSLIVTSEFAASNHLGVNGTLLLGTAAGERRFTVRGIMKSSGLSSAFGGNLAIMDIYAAQKMFGRGRTFDRIDLAVQPGQPIAECRRELGAALGPGFEIAPPSNRGQQFEAMLTAYSMMVAISSLFALFIGMFIIYNAFAIAVTQRRSEIGILRALGATRSQIRRLFLAESAVTGLIGSLGGILFGILIARGIAASIRSLITDVYGVAQRAAEVAATPALLSAAVAIGIATSMVAALVPAHNAARVDPIQALQKGKYQVLSAGENRTRVLLAVVLGAVSIVCLGFAAARPVFYLGYFLAVGVALLLTPVLSLGLARALRPMLKRLRPVEGALAADSLIQAPRRTAASVAALMLALAMAIAFAGMARASYASISDWVDVALNPDLFVLPSPNIVIRTIRFPASIQAEVGSVPGVARVQPVRQARVTFRGSPVMIVAVERIGSLEQGGRRIPVEGYAEEMYRLAAAGRGLIISDNFAKLQQLHLGDMIEIGAPEGMVRLPVAGVVVDYSDQLGTILMDRSVFERYWNDDTINVLRVYLAPGAQVSEVKRRILERYDGRRQVFVLTNGELRAYILRITDQWFSLSWIQLAVAVLVALLGIVNTLTVSITDRRRELGVLQAVGGLKAQIRHTVWMEAISIGAIGLALGFMTGAVNLYYILQVAEHISGMRLDYQFPVGVASALVPLIGAAAFLAAIWPAESAVHGSLVEALEYE
jgi:putative ABC transport system permease protein